MISSIGVIKRKSASEHKSEMKFEHGVKVVVEVVIEVVIVASPPVRKLQRACNQRQRLRLRGSVGKLVGLLRGEFHWRFLPSHLSGLAYSTLPWSTSPDFPRLLLFRQQLREPQPHLTNPVGIFVGRLITRTCSRHS